MVTVFDEEALIPLIYDLHLSSHGIILSFEQHHAKRVCHWVLCNGGVLRGALVARLDGRLMFGSVMIWQH